eukprot:356567-Chlamydomonas_euryale.AAC.3
MTLVLRHRIKRSSARKSHYGSHRDDVGMREEGGQAEWGGGKRNGDCTHAYFYTCTLARLHPPHLHPPLPRQRVACAVASPPASQHLDRAKRSDGLEGKGELRAASQREGEKVTGEQHCRHRARRDAKGVAVVRGGKRALPHVHVIQQMNAQTRRTTN